MLRFCDWSIIILINFLFLPFIIYCVDTYGKCCSIRIFAIFLTQEEEVLNFLCMVI